MRTICTYTTRRLHVYAIHERHTFGVFGCIWPTLMDKTITLKDSLEKEIAKILKFRGQFLDSKI